MARTQLYDFLRQRGRSREDPHSELPSDERDAVAGSFLERHPDAR